MYLQQDKITDTMKNFIFFLLIIGGTVACSTTNNAAKTDVDGAPIEDIALDLTQRIKMLSGVRVRGDRASAEITIGGPSSINGNLYPLFVLDGRQVDSYATLYSLVNTADIKRVEVLRNPVDLAFYGTRGANGVIKVTTNPE